MIFFRYLFLGLLAIFYRIRKIGVEHVPSSGGALLLANHVTWVDAFILSAACPRPVRFVIYSDFLRLRSISWFLKLFGVIPISPGKARDAIRATAEAIGRGDIVCLFPEGQLSRTGLLNELRRGFELIAQRIDGSPVIPVYLHGLWGSVFSLSGGRYFTKWPQRLPYPASVAFGEPLPAGASRADLRRALLRLSEVAIREEAMHSPSLGQKIVRTLGRRSGRPCLIEHGKRRRVLRRRHVLSIAMALARRWRDLLPPDQKRIGVLLPAGSPSVFVRLALILAGRVPVTLPLPDAKALAAGENLDVEWLAQALGELGVRSVVTPGAFAPALKGFPWRGSDPGNFIDMGQEMRAAGTLAVATERALIAIEPTPLLLRRFKRRFPGAAKGPGDEEVSILVAPRPAGSEPRVDVADPSTLIHCQSRAQVFAQVRQLEQIEWLPHAGRIYDDAPAHSAQGTLFQLWLPALCGHTWVGRSVGTARDRPLPHLWHEESIALAVTGPWTADDASTSAEETASRTESSHGPPEAEGPSRPSRFHIHFASAAAALPIAEEAPLARMADGAAWAPDSIGGLVALSAPDQLQVRDGQLDQYACRPGTLGRLLPGIGIHGEGSAGPSATDRFGLESLASATFSEHAQEVNSSKRSPRLELDPEGFLSLAADRSGQDP